MRTVRDALIIILGLFGLVSIRVWEKLLNRRVSYYDWPNHSSKEYSEAVRELHGRVKTKHNPAS